MAEIAALPMYDFPQIRQQTDRFWSAIRNTLQANGIIAPQNLTWPDDVWAVWQAPDLVLAQTCGLPFIRELADKVTLLGAPDYSIFPDQPAVYNSVVIIQKEDPRQSIADMRGAAFAYNDLDSQSGLYSPMFMVATEFGDDRFFDTCIASGSHSQSINMVATGQADIAAIDAVTWRYLNSFQQSAKSVRILTQTSKTPGLPFICAKNQDAEAITQAVESAIATLTTPDRTVLGIRGFKRSTRADYDIIASRAERVSVVLKKHGLGG